MRKADLEGDSPLPGPTYRGEGEHPDAKDLRGDHGGGVRLAETGLRETGLRRRGIVLVIVLVVVVVLSLAGYTFSSLMLTHRQAVKVSGQQLQARLLVDSGVEAVKVYLSQDLATREAQGGHFDNPLLFQGVSVIPDPDPLSRGSFAVVAPLADDSQMSSGVRYGLEDESIRVNLNVLLLADQMGPGTARNLLLGLPGMTEDVADAILDWIDEDEDPRDYGAEAADYYSGLDPPYAPRNGPATTVEELLLVRGVTPDLLFGLDQNRNGMVDPHESGAMGGTLGTTSTAAGTTTVDTFPERGWSAYLTLYSAERNTSDDGQPRINLNNDDLQALSDELSEVFDAEWVNFILAYRLYGPDDDDEGGDPRAEVDPASIELDLSQQPQARINQVLDLIGARVRLSSSPEGEEGGGQGASGGRGGGDGGGGPGGGGGQGDEPEPILTSPFAEDALSMAAYLPALMNYCTVVDAPVIPGRININQAPPEILQGIPGVTEEILDALLNSRDISAEDAGLNRDHETWLLTEGIVTLDEMRTLLPLVTAGGDVFRAQIVGYYQGGGPASRAEVVWDATDIEPRVLFWRDISHLGRGYALQTLGVDLAEGLAGVR